MGTVFLYLKPYRIRIVVQMLIKLSGACFELLIPWMLSYMLDEIVPQSSLNRVLIWGICMLGVSVACWVTNLAANKMSLVVSREFTRQLRHDLFQKITRLSSRQADRLTNASLSSRLTSDTYHLHNMVDRMQRMGIRAPSFLIGGMVITFSLEPTLSMIILAMIPILLYLVILIAKKGIVMYKLANQALDRMVRKIQEFAVGIRVIKALSKTEYERTRFRQTIEELSKKESTATVLMALSSPLMNLFLNLGMTLVIIMGAVGVNNGEMKPGVIIAFLSYFTIILNSFMMISRMFILLTRGVASAKRIEEVLLLPEEHVIRRKPPQETRAHVVFRDVSFSYNGKEATVSHISFSLRQGEVLGIIGATGSGKTTIVNLLLRLYDADTGEILIGGRSVDSIPKEELYRMFGVCFQNGFLFSDTIRENITFGREIEPEALDLAVQSAQGGFIREKEGGYDERLTVKGNNLSGGQKQRVLISRALAANPEILILDDSSSALDYKTDAALRAALQKNWPDTTCVIIAQRISSILHADHILLMDEGEISGRGTHEELLTSNERYREIYRVQMGGAP